MRLVPVLDETDIKILEYLRQGYSIRDITRKVWKSYSSVGKRLHGLRKFYGVRTTIQLIVLLNKESI